MSQHIQFAGAKGEGGLEAAKQNLYDRSPLIDKDNKLLYIKLSDTDPETGEQTPYLQKISSSPDNKNIVLNSDGNLELNDIINVTGIVTKPNDGAPASYGNILYDSTGDDHTIILFTKISEYQGVISGELLEKGEGVLSAYHFSVSNTGSRSLEGASNLKKASFVQCVYKDGQNYYGIKFPSGIPADIYFHGYSYMDRDSLPPEEYYDSEFEEINEVADSANYAATIKSVPYSSWDFTFVPDAFTQNTSNYGVSFGGGLVIETGHTTGINTTNTCQGPNGTNTGYLNIYNSMRMEQDNWIRLSMSQPGTVNIYFTTSNNGNARTVILYDSDKETVLAESQNTDMYRYTTLTYENTSNEKRDFYICTEGGAVRIYLISNYTPSQKTNSQIITESISSLPKTGEDGEPNILKFSGLTFSLSDLNSMANLCKDSDYKIILDLSNCCVNRSDSGAVNWTTAIFADCNSLDTLYMPSGVNSIGANVFSGCSFMQHIYVNRELSQIYGSAYGASTIGAFGGTQIREITFKNDNIKLGGFWATASAFRYVVFSENFDYTDGDTGWIMSGNGNSDWLTSAPAYMKFCMQEKVIRHLKTDSNTWWLRNWGDAESRIYAYYGVDSDGNYLLSPYSELKASGSWATGAILDKNNNIIFPAK